MTHVALFDYGAGNLHSLAKGLEAGGAKVTATSDWGEALARDALVLPGVGSFGAAVRGLRGEAERVRDALLEGLPCLGICLGMQLLFPRSEEAEGTGIGLIPGHVRKFRTRIVPQMGWNDIVTDSDQVFEGARGLSAYFANSFVCEVASEAKKTRIAHAEYDGQTFAAAVRKGPTVGLQFHPEKSSRPGLQILANFVEEVRLRGSGG